MHATPPGEDTETVRGFLAGERAALARVDAWIQGAARPFRRSLSASWDDVLQDVRVEALRLLRGGRFRAESRLRTYLWRVTSRSCLDALRRQRRRAFAELEPLAGTLASAEPSPFDRAAYSERNQALAEAGASLPSSCRQVFELILTGLSRREIAARLRLSDGALRVRIHRCRRHLLRQGGSAGRPAFLGAH